MRHKSAKAAQVSSMMHTHKSAKAAQVSESSTSRLNATQVGEDSTGQLNAAQVGEGSTSQQKQLNGGLTMHTHKTANVAQ
jgi:hypothetical protein